MTHSSSQLPRRIRGSIVQWFRSRRQECVRCFECGNEITPFTSCCPQCGQANPAKVSLFVVVYLVLGFVLLTFTLSFLIIVF
jgi:uncharacterized OB-fold protein